MPQTTLYLVLRTGADETEKGIISRLKAGLEASGATTAGDPTIKAVSPAFVEEFEALADRAAAAPAPDQKEGISLRLLPSRETVYEVKVPPTQLLKKLKVTYQKAGVKEYEPAAPGTKSPLVLTVPGRYALTPEAGDVPSEYEGTMSELGEPDSTSKGAWPKSDKSFVVTMRNFTGDRQRLFLAIQNKKVIANPFKDVRLGNDLVFAFASLNSSIDDDVPATFDRDNNLLIRIKTLQNSDPKRVWVYLALDEKAVAGKMAEFAKADDGAALSALIRKNAVPIGQPAALGPADAPRWFELPPVILAPGIDPAEFERKVKLTGVPALAAKYPRLWTLVVWEFDAGRPEAILVKGDKGNRVYVRDKEVAGWVDGVKEAVKRAEPPAPTP